MKIKPIKENVFTTYEVNISFTVNYSTDNEKHKFTNIGQAKQYIRNDYALKKLKGTVSFYKASIIRKTETVLYITEDLNEV